MINFVEINDVKCAYTKEGSGQDVILLHGWGQNIEMMSKISEHLKNRFCVYTIDFPGHGQSDLPSSAWGVIEYEEFLEDFVRKMEITNPILIGHSFGCRVAIRYASKNEVSKMVLTGAAGIKPKRTTKMKAKTAVYKTGKWFLKATGQKKKLEELQNNSGSSDYRNAKGIMRPTFVKVVNDDITDLLPTIQCPVLLVWGEYDQAVPLSDGKMMEKLIPNAGLAVFENDDHFAYWNESDRFNRVLDAFL